MRRKKHLSRTEKMEAVPPEKILHSYKGAAEYMGNMTASTVYTRYNVLGVMAPPDYYLDGVTPLWKQSTLDHYKATYVDGRSKRRKASEPKDDETEIERD